MIMGVISSRIKWQKRNKGLIDLSRYENKNTKNYTKHKKCCENKYRTKRKNIKSMKIGLKKRK